MNNIALGRYLPLNSVVDKMDPRAKILIMLLLMIAIFIPAGFWGYLLIFAFIWIALKLSKLTIGFALRSMKPMLFMMVFLLVINVFAIKTGVPLVQWGWFSIYSDAISQTVYIIVRLLLMVIITTILTATTKPLDLTLGIEKLLKPFEVIGVPAHIIAMMISIALRFIPTLIEETQRIMNAQASRGVDLENGTLKEKIMAVLALIVPLFVSAFDRADQLANAMEARGYDPQRERTRYKVLQMTGIDYAGLAAAAAVLAGCIVLALVR
ncbi:energy-coupling factor transporter transmembrane component T family protein [Faecalibaculum rodentium]|uniref:ABC-type cobalt transport system, permease component CbiQ and related transporter n=3 Tax=Faecalibaculum rodentium TaxID=1702221 RepID=A0A140DSI4_9FIRM|nr:energy-coupling factor transporter transmembrane component T [Faecalibaculum rodentium]AMK53611.1 ABC-type cobalt transport system, permease component CbiQ and related transporter [Faecalibaculum rodentium]